MGRGLKHDRGRGLTDRAKHAVGRKEYRRAVMNQCRMTSRVTDVVKHRWRDTCRPRIPDPVRPIAGLPSSA